MDRVERSNRARVTNLLAAAMHFAACACCGVGFGAGSEASPARIDPAGISGALVIAGGGALPDAVFDRFIELAGKEDARVVVVPTAGASADDAKNAEATIAAWRERGIEHVSLLHTRDRDAADSEEFCRALTNATAVWFNGGSQSRIAEAYVGTKVERELHKLLERGGVIGGSSAGAAIMSRVMIASGNPVAKEGTGFDLLPGAIIDQHFLARKRLPRLERMLETHPGLFGIGIDEGTAVVVRGRRISVLGESTATICLAAGQDRQARRFELKSGRSADLTALRRAAFDRTQSAFPPVEPDKPVVEQGALVIVGGGGVPDDVAKKFIELAGGPDTPIVIVPTSREGRSPSAESELKMFREAGAENLRVFHGRRLEDVESPEQLAKLTDARGIWFSGGRQWRATEAYLDTEAHEAFLSVLRRGGVIGGSSAGASLQAEYLARGDPLGSRTIMAEGYERGFAFLPGVAIDQHFKQRNRFADLAKLVDRYPQLLGIGIDEGTALIVRGPIVEIRGKGEVHFYKRPLPADSDSDHTSLPAGSRYDLVKRAVVDKVPDTSPKR